MAKSKKETENNDKTLVKTIKEQDQIIKSLKKDNQETLNAFELFQKQMQDMQSAFIKMQSKNDTPKDDSSGVISIGCRFINGVTLYSPKREVEIRVPYAGTVEISENELQMLLKTQFVKEFLRKDVVFFVNEENYKIYKILNRQDLGDEKLIKIITTSDQNKLIGQFNNYTTERRDDPVMHTLFYRIVELCTDGKLSGMSYENRKAIESYFKCSIENAQLMVSRVNGVK